MSTMPTKPAYVIHVAGYTEGVLTQMEGDAVIQCARENGVPVSVTSEGDTLIEWADVPATLLEPVMVPAA